MKAEKQQKRKQQQQQQQQASLDTSLPPTCLCRPSLAMRTHCC